MTHLESIAKQDSITIAAKKILAKLFQAMVNREEGTLKNEDVEELHQMRVATRRMRVLLRNLRPYFEPALFLQLRDDLRRTGLMLGQTRDIDSFILFLQACEKELPPSVHPALEHLLDIQRERRRQEQEQVRRELNSPEYRAFKQRLVEMIESDSEADQAMAPAGLMVPLLLLHNYKRVLDFQGRVRNALVNQLHELRIEIKHLRYMCEFFQPLYPIELAGFLDDLIKLQNLLGKIHDKDRDARFLEENQAEITSSSAAVDHRSALENLITHLRQSQEESRQSFFRIWREFTFSETQLKYRALLNDLG